MEKIQNYIRKYIIIIIPVLAIPAVWALFVNGYFGASDDLHISWLYEMDRTLSLWQFPPRFVPDLSFGFGYPLFDFVFPLPFYIGEIFHKIGFSLVDSVKAVFLISIPFSMYFMYKFLKVHTNEILALAGAVLYVYTPYRATDIYVRGAIGEIFAFIFPPLIALGISKISINGNKKWIGVLASGISGLILSHNIMAYMFTPFLALLVVVQRKNILKSVYGFALGGLISLYFWLPAIIDSKLMKYDTVFNFVDHFPTLKQLVTPYFGYGASVPGPYDGMSFFIGLINLMLIILALVFAKKARPIVYWSLLVIVISVYLMNFRSGFVWANFPFLPYFQFPWRFLSLTTFATSILVVIFDKFKYGKQVGLTIIIGAILLNFSDYKPHDFLGRTDSYYLNRYIPYPVASTEYKMGQEEYLRLPRGVNKRPDRLSNNPDLNKKYTTTFTKAQEDSYEKYFFPGWEVKIDGKKVNAWAGEPFGQITFNVPGGEHVVSVNFKETSFKILLDLISAVGIIFAIKLLVSKK